jgi:hypothetical protein
MLKVGGATSESLEPKRIPSDVPAMHDPAKREIGVRPKGARFA